MAAGVAAVFTGRKLISTSNGKIELWPFHPGRVAGFKPALLSCWKSSAVHPCLCYLGAVLGRVMVLGCHGQPRIKALKA